MRPPVPLPTDPPFMTLITMTYMRPEALARNLESVAKQTARDDLEQLVFPDHVGYGIAGGLYGRLSWYANAVRGRYVAFLNDDDALADESVVERLRAKITYLDSPPVAVVRVRKGDVEFPRTKVLNPMEGDVDLGSYIVRRDVWKRHLNDYGMRYQGDFDHATVLYVSGYRHERLDLLFAVGPQGGGRPEVDWR